MGSIDQKKKVNFWQDLNLYSVSLEACLIGTASYQLGHRSPSRKIVNEWEDEIILRFYWTKKTSLQQFFFAFIKF